MADTIAPAGIREVDKDVLVGEHIRQHRRTMWLARSGVTALVGLLIASLVAWNQAVAAQHTAIARGMVAQADRIRDQDPREALQLGVAAEQWASVELRVGAQPIREARQPCVGRAVRPLDIRVTRSG